MLLLHLGPEQSGRLEVSRARPRIAIHVVVALLVDVSLAAPELAAYTSLLRNGAWWLRPVEEAAWHEPHLHQLLQLSSLQGETLQILLGHSGEHRRQLLGKLFRRHAAESDTSARYSQYLSAIMIPIL